MSPILSGVILIALIAYFLFNFRKNLKRRKALYNQGEYKTFYNYSLSFYIYMVCDVILIGYLIFRFKHLSIFEIIIGIFLILVLGISTFLNTKVILANKGLFYIYYYLDYAHITEVKINKVGSKYLINFLKNGKIILKMKLAEDKKTIVKNFISKRKVRITEK